MNKQVKKPKETSYEYGLSYQLEQVEKHKNRYTNHWKERVNTAHRLVENYLKDKDNIFKEKIKILDVGCSIGTIAIEMAAKGHEVYGVDFDEDAIKVGKKLCKEEGVDVNFIHSDVSSPNLLDKGPFDIALCFDIFEHLHDDELGAFLSHIKKSLKADGVLIFYSFPLQYDYIFYGRWYTRLPLRLLRWLPLKIFEKLVKSYAALLDSLLILFTGKSYQKRISKEAHCNPTTIERLSNILKRGGFTIENIDSGNIYPFQKHINQLFSKHPVANRQVWGLAKIKS